MSFIICSYFTLGTVYSNIAHKYLFPSLVKLGLKGDVCPVYNLGSWQANTSYKPTFIKQMMEKHRDKNIVFVDVDAEVLEYPKLFEEIPEKHCLACHILDKEKWYQKDFRGEKEVLSGTLFIRNNSEARQLVDEWIKRCSSTVIWEQKVLQQILQENNVEVFELPIDYCYIKTLPCGSAPHVKCEKPVIVHHLMSRKTKGKIRKDF